jgi:hypothetical protein
MMKYRRTLGIAVALTFATVVGTASVARSQRITEANGQVILKREGWSDYRQIREVGYMLQSRDTLKSAGGVIVEVQIACSNGDVEQVRLSPIVPSNVVIDVCKRRFPPRPKRAEIIHRPGGSNPEIPYTLMPRMTYLLDERPTFRWNQVAGATSYTVYLLGPGGFVEWQTQTSSNEVVYPEDADPLQWGIKYLLVVETDNDRSSVEGAGGNLGFELFREDRVELVRQKADNIAEQDLSEEGEALALAELYSRRYLIADAIRTLEALVEQGNQNPLVYSMLGGLYAEAGLNLRAEERYQKAIALFKPLQSRDELAQARVNLAVVKSMLGKEDEAKELIEQAKVGDPAFDNPQGVEDLEQMLETISAEPTEDNNISYFLTPRDS